MEKKTASAIMLTLLLTSISMAVLNSQMFIVSAEEIHDVAITGVVPNKTTIVFPDQIGDFLVSVNGTNRGTEYEIVILTVFLDSPNHPYSWCNTTWAPGIPCQFIVQLCPSLYDLGTWNLVASLSIVPGETNTSDNVYIYGPITVAFEHDVAVTNVVASQTHVTVGDPMPVSVSVRNLGIQAETFTVTAYFGSGWIGFDTETVTLDDGETRTLNMIWDTAGVVPNSYQIGAYASQVPGEMNLANNDYPDGTVVIIGLPYKPTNLRAELVAPYSLYPQNPTSKSQVLLYWSAPTGAPQPPSDYDVYRGTSPSNMAFVGSTSGKTFFSDEFPTASEIYYYGVSAVFPKGQSILSDPIAFGSLEGTNGIENEIYLEDIAAGTVFTIQQNFKIPRGIEGYYWIQNVVFVDFAGFWMGGKIQIFNFTRNAAGSYELTGGNPIVDEPNRLIAPFGRFGLFMSPLVLRATIDGMRLLIENPFLMEHGAGPYVFAVPEGSYISQDLRSHGSSVLDPFNASPEIVIVSNPFTNPLFPVSFIRGSGKINSYVRHSTPSGNLWYICDSNEIIDDETKKASTAEKSIGLKWDATGNFQHAIAKDQGLWFAPSYDLSVSNVPGLKTAEPLAGIVFHIFCPAYLSLYDSIGNMCGYNSSSGLVENNIPSAQWLSNQTICLFNVSSTYRLIVVGTEEGTFTLQKTLQNEIGSTAVLLNETDTITHGASKSWVLSPTIEGNYTVSAVSSLSVSISPLSASILVGQSVTFTSTVSGEYTPYAYQWYLNGVPVSGATSNTWTFTPATSGIYYIHLKVTDDIGNTAQSETARITATTVPVGGYSFPIQVQTKAEPVLPYIALVAALTAVFTKLRPKTRRKR